MKKHFRYLWYVIKHKFYVIKEGKKLNIPLRMLIIHDWQKFTPTEWKPYVLTFFGEWKYNERPPWLVDSFNKAWLHHIHYGKHHWQHWILIYDNDKEDYGLLEAPDNIKKEMLADWRAAAYAKKGIDDTKEWYIERQEKFNKLLHPNTKEWIEKQLGI